MSWFLNLVGSPAAVKAKIEADTCLSASLKAAIIEICNDNDWSGKPSDTIRVKGSGHCGSGSSITSLEVERVILAPEPAKTPEVASDPQSPANPPDGT